MLPSHETSNLRATAVLGVQTNEGVDYTPILPERFGSTSLPSNGPIVQPELNSISQPKLDGSVYSVG